MSFNPENIVALYPLTNLSGISDIDGSLQFYNPLDEVSWTYHRQSDEWIVTSSANVKKNAYSQYTKSSISNYGDGSSINTSYSHDGVTKSSGISTTAGYTDSQEGFVRLEYSSNTSGVEKSTFLSVGDRVIVSDPASDSYGSDVATTKFAKDAATAAASTVSAQVTQLEQRVTQLEAMLGNIVYYSTINEPAPES